MAYRHASYHLHGCCCLCYCRFKRFERGGFVVGDGVSLRALCGWVGLRLTEKGWWVGRTHLFRMGWVKIKREGLVDRAFISLDLRCSMDSTGKWSRVCLSHGQQGAAFRCTRKVGVRRTLQQKHGIYTRMRFVCSTHFGLRQTRN